LCCAGVMDSERRWVINKYVEAISQTIRFRQLLRRAIVRIVVPDGCPLDQINVR